MTPPRYVTAYGNPDDLAREIERAYGADTARRFRDHVAARDAIDEALSPTADVAAAVMAQRDELARIAAGLRADPALRDSMLMTNDDDVRRTNYRVWVAREGGRVMLRATRIDDPADAIERSLAPRTALRLARQLIEAAEHAYEVAP
jgi:hypothetical protein